MVKEKKRQETWATGRRKTSIARVRMFPGDGSITVNNRPYENYFGRQALQIQVQQPLVTTQSRERYSIVASILGGGIASQAGALRHGISRALIALNPDNRKVLKPNGFLTRDSRIKERRKVGHRKARRSPQYSKR